MPLTPSLKIPPIYTAEDAVAAIYAIQRHLAILSNNFDNAVGNAISPVGSGNSAAQSNGALTITTAPTDITYTPTIATNPVNKTVEAAINITFTKPERAVGVEVFYREVGAANFKQSYASASPYRLIIMQPGIPYELQLAGEAANGDLGPRSPLVTINAESDAANIAPGDAHYVVTQTHSDLSNEHILQGEESVITIDSPPGIARVGIAPLGVSTAKIADLAVTTAKLDDLAVTTAKIDDNAVGNSKLSDMQGVSVKVRNVLTVGDPVNLQATVIDTVLARLTNDLQWSKVTNAMLEVNSVDNPQLTDNSVSEAKVQTNAISTAKIGDSQVTGPKLAAGSITSDKLNISGTPLAITRYNQPNNNIEPTPNFTTSTDGRLGINTAPSATAGVIVNTLGITEHRNATARFINDTGGSVNMELSVHTDIVARQGTVLGRRSQGNEAVQTAVAADTPMLRLGATAHNGTTIPPQLGSWIDLTTAEAHTPTNRASRIGLFITRTASTTQYEALRVDQFANLALGGVAGGTGMTGGIIVPNGTAPTAAHPANAVQMWAANMEGVAGQSSLHIRSADGFLTRIGSGFLTKLRALSLSTNDVANPFILTHDQSLIYLIVPASTAAMQYIQLPATLTGPLGLLYIVSNHRASPGGVRVLGAPGQFIAINGLISTSGGYAQSQTVHTYAAFASYQNGIWIGLFASSGWTVA